MLGDTAQDEQIRERINDIDESEPAEHPEHQALMGELVDNVEHADPVSFMGTVLDKVIGPDMIAMITPQPNACAVIKPETTALGLLLGDLQPFASPDSLDPLVVDEPSSTAQQLGDLAIAVAAILPLQLNDVGRQPLLIIMAPRNLALR